MYFYYMQENTYILQLDVSLKKEKKERTTKLLHSPIIQMTKCGMGRSKHAGQQMALKQKLMELLEDYFQSLLMHRFCIHNIL